MRFKPYIVILFIFVSVWNSFLMGASGVMMCLNGVESPHSETADSREICCHTPDAGTLVGCGNCVDIELDGIDFLTTRDPDLPLPNCRSSNNGLAFEIEAIIEFADFTGLRPVRGPPVSRDTSLQVAETTVLRL